MTYTRHGHHIPGTDAVAVDKRPPVARCGGPAMCKQCATDALTAQPDLGKPLHRQEYPTMSELQVDTDKYPVGLQVTTDMVNHPPHYGAHPSGVECITITEHMNFNVGNAVKYLWRADHKNGIEDLKKARWYIDREIARLEKDTS